MANDKNKQFNENGNGKKTQNEYRRIEKSSYREIRANTETNDALAKLVKPKGEKK